MDFTRVAICADHSVLMQSTLLYKWLTTDSAGTAVVHVHSSKAAHRRLGLPAKCSTLWGIGGAEVKWAASLKASSGGCRRTGVPAHCGPAPGAVAACTADLA